MALYKHGNYLTQTADPAFDAEHRPATVVSNSGIYRCKNCGDEIAANKNNPLPPQNHHQHANGTPIVWQLLVYPVQK